MQKFHKGDWVRIAKDLGWSMKHFTADTEAIVVGSYADQYGGKNYDSYTLHIKDQGQSSWYYESQLTLIESGRSDKLAKWQAEQAADIKQKSDLDWIFSNGPAVAEKGYSASIAALAECFGMTNLWGKSGEGFVYYQNALATLELARPYLESNDKDGWLRQCKQIIITAAPAPAAQCKRSV